MQVTFEENEKYRKFVNAIAIDIGIFAYEQDAVVWHYTNGQGLIGILESGTIHATQVSGLNDPDEVAYATSLYKDALRTEITNRLADQEATAFYEQVLGYLDDPPDSPSQGTSKFFVACFSGDDDEATQWDRYSKPNGYAIGFQARGLCREPTSRLYRVVYDEAKQKDGANRLAKATLDFYREGLIAERAEQPEEWAKVFFAAWDEWMYKLAPLAKANKWKSENEYRLVHELKVSELPQVRFKQAKQSLARYLVLDTPSWLKRRKAILPIVKIRVGPGNEQATSRISIRLLLEQMGYVNVSVESTNYNVRR